jgi:hypothetical protein
MCMHLNVHQCFLLQVLNLSVIFFVFPEIKCHIVNHTKEITHIFYTNSPKEITHIFYTNSPKEITHIFYTNSPKEITHIFYTNSTWHFFLYYIFLIYNYKLSSKCIMDINLGVNTACFKLLIYSCVI